MEVVILNYTGEVLLVNVVVHFSRYNPYVQARSRIDQLKRLGHSVDKVEFILMGGTFMSLL
uniref:Uncharacterized protein n=1 Tax=Solanum lycopersicum TaxID=4081 RepID=A0A3Q7FQP3_SOLLC